MNTLVQLNSGLLQETVDLYPTSGPRVLLLPVTMRCNARCGMCTIWQQEPTGMSVGFLEHAFADGVLGDDIEYLGITGGEPTTLKEFDKVALYAISQSSKLREMSFNTNAFLTDRVVAAVETLLEAIRGRDVNFQVYVSLDGVGEVHDKVRGCGGAFRRTSRTLERLKQLLDGLDNVRLSLNSVICCDNAATVEETFRHARQLDLPINFSLVMQTDVCIDSASSEVAFEVRPDQIKPLRSALARLRMLTRLKNSGDIERRYFDHLLRMLDGLPRQLPCPFADGDGCLIDPYGDVYPCGKSRSMLMGNLRQSSFREIWYNRGTWQRLAAELPGHCIHCESNCFIHAAEEFDD